MVKTRKDIKKLIDLQIYI